LASITKTLLAASLNKGSTEVYKRSWKLFTDWAQSFLGVTTLVLPLTPAVVAANKQYNGANKTYEYPGWVMFHNR
jgi:hypothetical protein